VSHLKKIIVVEVEYNKHLDKYGAQIQSCLPSGKKQWVESIGGASVVQVEEWIVEKARELHLIIPSILRGEDAPKR